MNISVIGIRYAKKIAVTTIALLIIFIINTEHARVLGLTQDNGSIGLEGTVSAPAPTASAVISFPRDGHSVKESLINVTGICPDGLLVKIFKNNVFAGSVQCNGGNYSITIDLFSGQNEIVARVYDALDQTGPDSNIVKVFFDDASRGALSRVSLTSNFAKRGASPGQTLAWPIILTGGEGTYAITVDWGDGKDPDLISREFPGNFDIQHVYDNPGVYNIVIKAVDKNRSVAYLQLVGVGNGPLSQQNAEDNKDGGIGATKTKVLWQPAALLLSLSIVAFWLGRRYQIKMLRKRIEQGESFT